MQTAPQLEFESDRFKLVYAENKKTSRMELVLFSKADGRHRAAHSTFNLLNDNHQMVDVRPITPDVAAFIMRNFDRRGDTESFNIYASDLAADRLIPRSNRSVMPDGIRHVLTTTEKSFTATGAKLAAHWPIFEKYKDTSFGSIIRATMTNHQVCSSRCQFCSTISRNKRDSVTLAEAQAFVEALYSRQAEYNRTHFPEYNDAYKALTGSDIRLRGLILSGGGQPNLWPHFTEFVEWLSERDIDLGLITNGFPPKLPEEIYLHFKWVRISITPDDASPFYPEGRFERQYIPAVLKHNPGITVGYSYVFGPWTDDTIVERIAAAIEENGFDYCRMLTDCNLTRESQLLAHRELADKLFQSGHIDAAGKPTGRIFQQLKYHGTPEEAKELWDLGQCYLQSYNVFWDTTGHEEHGRSYCYPCDSVTVLAEEDNAGHISVSERKFNPEKWGTVPNTEVARLFEEPVRPFFDPRETCTSCLFMRNNQSVKKLASHADYSTVEVAADIEHVNFP